MAALALVAGLASVQAAAQQYQSSPERRTVEEKDWGQWLGPFRAKLVPSLMQDFGERYLYAPANAALPAPRPGEKRVVFLGDSITDRWNLTASFPGKPYVNRGIGSQVTAQMVLRSSFWRGSTTSRASSSTRRPNRSRRIGKPWPTWRIATGSRSCSAPCSR